MQTFQLWQALHDLFDTDDGSLPEIQLENLTGPQVQGVLSFLRAFGRDASAHDAKSWDNLLQQELPAITVENAAALVVKGRADPFHLLIGGLTFDGVTIPDLGVFVFNDSLALDYRMGQEWGPAELGALFGCLRQISELAPEMQVTLQPYVDEASERRFHRVWRQFLRKGTA